MPLTEAPYLTAEQVRAAATRGAPALSSDKFSDQWVQDVVAEFEQLVEQDLEVAQTPREETEVIRVDQYAHQAYLGWGSVRSIESLTIDGVTIPATGYRYIAGPGILVYPAGFFPTTPATVIYRHGLDAPSVALKRACALYVERVAALDTSGNTRDIARQGFDGGSTSFVMPDPQKGKLTGFADVDRIIAALPRRNLMVG